MQCRSCGANVPVPPELSATTAKCQYCGTVNTLSSDLLDARLAQQQHQLHKQQHQLDIQQHAFRQQDATDAAHQHHVAMHHAQRSHNIFRVMGVLVPLIIAGSAFWYISMASSSSGSHTDNTPVIQAKQPSTDPAKNGRKELDAMIGALEKKGCKHKVVAPASARDSYKTTITTKAGGNCFHVLAAAAKKKTVRITLKDPDGKDTKKNGKGTAELSRCPTAGAGLALTITSKAKSGFSHAVIDCPADEAFHRKHSGLGTVSKAMKGLSKLGCNRVMQQPIQVSGARTITFTIHPGGYCPHVLAATGIKGATLSAKVTDTFGESAMRIDAKSNFQLIECVKTEGQYKIDITPPKDGSYYAFGTMDCPRSLAQKQLAAQKRDKSVSLDPLLK